MKYEYTRVEIGLQAGSKQQTPLMNRLNSMGAEGWEAIDITHNARAHIVMFKRQIDDEILVKPEPDPLVVAIEKLNANIKKVLRRWDEQAAEKVEVSGDVELTASTDETGDR